jgi:hypothetical protein
VSLPGKRIGISILFLISPPMEGRFFWIVVAGSIGVEIDAHYLIAEPLLSSRNSITKSI